MRSIVLFLFTIYIIGCTPTNNYISNANQNTETIPYLLPMPVQILLEKKMNEELNTLYFSLDRKSEQNYIIYLEKYDPSQEIVFWVKNTNRYVYVGNHFYPLIFKLDEIFSTPEGGEKVKDKLKTNDFKLKEVNRIRHNVYHIEFNKKGQILYEGY